MSALNIRNNSESSMSDLIDIWMVYFGEEPNLLSDNMHEG